MPDIPPNNRYPRPGKRQLLFLFLLMLIVFLLVLTLFVPDIVSGDFEQYCKQYLGENYRVILIATFVLGTAILAYFIINQTSFLGSSKKKRLEALTIPWSLEKEAYTQAAKEAVRQSDLDEAIKNLYELNVEALDEEINMIASRLAKYNKETLQGTSSYENQSVTYNRITRDIFKLIDAVGKSLEEEGVINSTIKGYLLERYENRLGQKLAGRQPINISKTPSSAGTTEATSSYFVTLSQETVQAEIKRIFEEAKGRLLITGNPGAGKTVVMLQLVTALLKEKQSAIPVLLNLATWQSSFYKLEAWLEEILPTEMGVNKTLGKKVLKEIPLILLLDGFDEVKEEDRISCLEAIGRYGANAKHRFIIATRKQEYIDIRKDAPVFLQIEVEPLQIDQIKKELKQIGYEQPEALPLLSALEEEEPLQKMLITPFYFNILQLLFAQGIRLNEIKVLLASNEKAGQVIVEFFLNQQLHLEKDSWRKKDARRWLSFLASRMNRDNLVVFEFKDLQYSWWEWNRIEGFISFLIATLIIGVSSGIVVGIFVGLFGVMITVVIGIYYKIVIADILFHLLNIGLIGGVGGILYGLVNTLPFSFTVGTKKDAIPLIYTKDQISITVRLYLKYVTKNITGIGIETGLKYGFFAGLLAGFTLGLDLAIKIGCFIGIAVMLLVAMTRGLSDILNEEFHHFIKIVKPYQRFTASAKRLHFSILQHWHLRYLLYKKGLLPKKLVSFLNKLVQNNLLETDGATWRFRHRILQDYFAELWEKEYAEKYDDKSKKE